MPKVKLPVRQRHIEVFLKSKDRADECPEIDRCQLELVRNEDQALVIEDTDFPQSKLVRVGIVKVGSGCAYKVRVGLTEQGGPIAVGSEIVLTTTIVVTVTEVLSSGETSVSSTSTVSTEISDAIAAGTYPKTLLNNTDTEVTTRPGKTTTTVTHREVVASLRPWECRLNSCLAPKETWLNLHPMHLLHARYRLPGSVETVILIVCQDIVNTNWHVIVNRRGGVSNEPLRQSYSPANDGLVVSAALSRDLQQLFIVESRSLPGGLQTEATYHLYGYNRYSGEWSLTRTGTVPAPYSAPSPRPYIVDRDGDVVGYWATESTTRFDQWAGDGNNCQTVSGRKTIVYYRDYSQYWGGAWNIVSMRYSHGKRRRNGLTLYRGDVTPVEEHVSSPSSQVFASSSYIWLMEEPAFDQWQDQINDDSLHFRVAVGEASFGYTKDFGIYRVFSANSNHMMVSYPDPSDPWGWKYNLTTDYYFSAYAHHDGSTVMTVTPGGWVTIADTALIRNADLSSYHRFDEGLPSGTLAPCPDLSNWLEVERVTERTVADKKIVYPINLGEHVAIFRSFSAVDQASGTEYAGAFVQHQDGVDPTWHIFKNGADVTARIASCIGRPLQQLNSIYWRA